MTHSLTYQAMLHFNRHRFPALLTALAAGLLLAGCTQAPLRESSTSPVGDTTDAATAPALDVPGTAPDWLPLHRRPRVGDFVIHYRIEAKGLTRLQRRTEVVAVDKQTVELRRTLGDGSGRPARVLQLRVDHDGRVLRAWQPDTDAAIELHASRQQHRTRLAPAETLTLVSGAFPIDQVVSRRTTDGPGVSTVYYLCAQIPFREVVSLTTQRRYRTAQLVKLLGTLSTEGATAGDSPVDDGWLLMHWGRGKR